MGGGGLGGGCFCELVDVSSACTETESLSGGSGGCDGSGSVRVAVDGGSGLDDGVCLELLLEGAVSMPNKDRS